MKVKVWNDNDYPHEELFRGDPVKLAPHAYVEMEDDDAILFRGQYTPIKIGADDQPMPSSYKMIRIEYPAKRIDAAATGYPCQACGKIYESQKVLEAHVDENHIEQFIDQEVAEKRKLKTKKEAA